LHLTLSNTGKKSAYLALGEALSGPLTNLLGLPHAQEAKQQY
jgi:hypothetical protein